MGKTCVQRIEKSLKNTDNNLESLTVEIEDRCAAGLKDLCDQLKKVRKSLKCISV